MERKRFRSQTMMNLKKPTEPHVCTDCKCECRSCDKNAPNIPLHPAYVPPKGGEGDEDFDEDFDESYEEKCWAQTLQGQSCFQLPDAVLEGDDCVGFCASHKIPALKRLITTFAKHTVYLNDVPLVIYGIRLIDYDSDFNQPLVLAEFLNSRVAPDVSFQFMLKTIDSRLHWPPVVAIIVRFEISPDTNIDGKLVVVVNDVEYDIRTQRERVQQHITGFRERDETQLQLGFLMRSQ